jgi:hypothetical protein
MPQQTPEPRCAKLLGPDADYLAAWAGLQQLAVIGELEQTPQPDTATRTALTAPSDDCSPNSSSTR